jgi:hypothetical protein
MTLALFMHDPSLLRKSSRVFEGFSEAASWGEQHSRPPPRKR